MISLELVVSYFIGVIFAISFINKIAHPKKYQDSISQTLVTSNYLSNIIYIFSCAVEFLIAGLMFTQYYVILTFIITAVVLVLYTMFLMSAHQKNVDCGCITANNEGRSFTVDLIRNLALIGIILYIIVLNNSWKYSLDLNLIMAASLVINYLSISKWIEYKQKGTS